MALGRPGQHRRRLDWARGAQRRLHAPRPRRPRRGASNSEPLHAALRLRDGPSLRRPVRQHLAARPPLRGHRADPGLARGGRRRQPLVAGSVLGRGGDQSFARAARRAGIPRAGPAPPAFAAHGGRVRRTARSDGTPARLLQPCPLRRVDQQRLPARQPGAAASRVRLVQPALHPPEPGRLLPALPRAPVDSAVAHAHRPRTRPGRDHAGRPPAAASRVERADSRRTHGRPTRARRLRGHPLPLPLLLLGRLAAIRRSLHARLHAVPDRRARPAQRRPPGTAPVAAAGAGRAQHRGEPVGRVVVARPRLVWRGRAGSRFRTSSRWVPPAPRSARPAP